MESSPNRATGFLLPKCHTRPFKHDESNEGKEGPIVKRRTAILPVYACWACPSLRRVVACTEAVAWFGAEVVKVENPNGSDPAGARSAAAPRGTPEYFLLLNANKKSLAINSKAPQGREIVMDMARRADVFVENFAPGVIERLDLGYDTLREINPVLIYAQVKGVSSGVMFHSPQAGGN